MRLQRLMAAAGIAARRVCEQMIAAGRVEVNGRIERELPVFVDPAADSVTVDGRTIPRVRRRESGSGQKNRGAHEGISGQRLLYVLAFKPERVLCTTRDEAGRPTIMDIVHHPAMASPTNPLGARLYPVGRLDFHTPGLVLMTNDGELANRITHARFGVPKHYRVVARHALDDEFLGDLERGLNLKHAAALREVAAERAPRSAWSSRERTAGSKPMPRVRGGMNDASGADPSHPSIMITVAARENDKTTLEISLLESGPRSLADMLREAGVQVTKVTRTGIGPLKLRGIGLGQWRELERDELRAIRRAAGL